MHGLDGVDPSQNLGVRTAAIGIGIGIGEEGVVLIIEVGEEERE